MWFSLIGTQEQCDALVAKIGHLEGKYRSLVARALTLVKQKVQSPSEFRIELTLLPTLMDNREEQLYNIKEHVSAITKADSVEEIFNLLNLRVWSYLNYHLLQHILRVYGDDDSEANRMMQQYVTTVEEFKATTTLYMFWSVQSKRPCPVIQDTLKQQLREVIFTHQELTLDSTLADVDSYRRDLAQHYSLPEFTTILVGIKPGCVTTVWLMSPSAVTVMEERIRGGDTRFLLKHGITKMQVDGRAVYCAGVLILLLILDSVVRQIPIYKKVHYSIVELHCV